MKKPVDYKQTDTRWCGNDYSAPGESTTIGKAGCGPSCMAMVIATLADAKITPADTAAWALKNKYKAKGQGTYYTYFGPQGKAYGLTVERVNTANLKQVSQRKAYHDKALEAVKAGDLVICCMGPGLWTKNGHYILWYGIEGDQAFTNDPGSSAPGRAKAPLKTLQAEVKYYWIVRAPVNARQKEDTVISVCIDKVRFLARGFLRENSSWIPVRTVAEALGGKVGWDEKTQTVTVNGKQIQIINQDGTVFAKARDLAAILGVKVDWMDNTKTVTFRKEE